jgi:hypothetical protein
LPTTTVTAAGEADSVKSTTVRVTVVVCRTPLPVLVTVIGYVPVAVLLPTVIVMADVPDPGAGIELGLKLTVVPAGAPVADRAIALLKPALTVVVRVDAPVLPTATVTAVGDAASVKSATVKVTVAVCCTPPPLPVTVIG